MVREFLMTFLLIFGSLPLLHAVYSIVFIHIGPELPVYVEDSVSQARLFNPNCPIYLAASQRALSHLPEGLKRANIQTITLESLKRTPDHRIFCSLYTVKDGFWRFTTERFFYLEEVMIQENLHQVFHLENDNMLYVDLEDLFPVFLQNYRGIGANFDNDNRCIPGFVYFADLPALHLLTAYIASLAHMGYNDMELLALYKNQVSEEAVGNLPIIMSAYFKSHAAVSPCGYMAKKPLIYSTNEHLFLSIFDAAALGQYLGGGGVHPPGFVNESCIFNPSYLQYSWEKDEQGRRVPYATFGEVKYRINNLHIHSKNLKLFSSGVSEN